MADWTDPPYAALTAGKKWTDEKAAAAFENPVALAEGAPDAPRIVGAAIQRIADLPAIAITASDNVTAEELADSVVGTLSTTSSSYVAARTWTMARATGTSVRVRLSHQRAVSENGNSQVRVVKNGVEVQSWSTTTETPQARTVDVSFVQNDVIEIQHRVQSGASGSIVSGIGIFGSDGYVPRLPHVLWSNRNVA